MPILDPAPRRSAGPDRRKHLRADVVMRGRLLDSAGVEHAFTTRNVSAGGALIDVPVNSALALGGLVLYIDGLGRIPAETVRRDPAGGHGLLFQITAAKRERVVESLTYLMNANKLGLAISEHRRMARYPGRGDVEIECDDGRKLRGEILDFSMVGLAVATKAMPPRLGQWVRCGASYGRVARYIPGGFAVDFEPGGAKHMQG